MQLLVYSILLFFSVCVADECGDCLTSVTDEEVRYGCENKNIQTCVCQSNSYCCGQQFWNATGTFVLGGWTGFCTNFSVGRCACADSLNQTDIQRWHGIQPLHTDHDHLPIWNNNTIRVLERFLSINHHLESKTDEPLAPEGSLFDAENAEIITGLQRFLQDQCSCSAVIPDGVTGNRTIVALQQLLNQYDSTSGAQELEVTGIWDGDTISSLKLFLNSFQKDCDKILVDPKNVYLVAVASSLTIVSCLAMIWSISKHQTILTERHRLLRLSALFDVLLGFSAIPLELGHRDGWGTFCAFQGVCIGWFGPSGISFTFAMCYHSYNVIVRKRPMEECLKMHKYYLVFAFGIAPVFNLVLFVIQLSTPTTIYSPAGVWCWVCQKWGIIRIFDYYGWIWLFMLGGAVCSFFLIKELKSLKFGQEFEFEFGEQSSNADQMQTKHIILTTVAYQSLEFLCYIPATADRVNEFFGASEKGLVSAHEFLIPFLGFVKAVVYFLMDSPKKNDVKLWNLRRILTTSRTFDIFLDHAEKHNCANDAEFWRYVQKEIVAKDWEHPCITLMEFRQIYNDFLKQGDLVSYTSLHINPDTRQSLETLFYEHAGHNDVATLDVVELAPLWQAQQEVYRHLNNREIFYSFIDSYEWEQFLAKTTPAVDLQQIVDASVAVSYVRVPFEAGSIHMSQLHPNHRYMIRSRTTGS